MLHGFQAIYMQSILQTAEDYKLCMVVVDHLLIPVQNQLSIVLSITTIYGSSEIFVEYEYILITGCSKLIVQLIKYSTWLL